jgi:flagellar hook-associated protein 2
MSSTSATSGVTLSNFTGLDFTSILNAETAAAQVPITAVENQLVAANTAISTLGTISGDFTSLQTALTNLNTSLTIPPLDATASSNAPFTASVTGTPANGTYTVNVNSLAAAQITASQGYAGDSAGVGDGTFSISVNGGAATPITINSTNDTLNGLASAINGASLGVTAQVVDTGAPGAPYRLELLSNSTGTSGSFTVSSNLSGGTAPDFAATEIGATDDSSVTGTAAPSVGGTYTGDLSQGYHFTVTSGGTVGTDPLTINWTSDSGESGTLNVAANNSGPIQVADGLTLSLGSGTLKAGDTFAAATFVPQVSTAQNAVVQVGNQIVTSPTNTVTNAISGVTLNLNGTGSGASVTVAPDLATEASNINAFVTAYNTAVSDINTNTQALPQQTAPALANDGGLRSTLFEMQYQLGTLNLSTLGITVNQSTGALVFSQSGFEQSAASNPTAVNQTISSLYSAINPTVSEVVAPTTGLIATETASDQSEVTSYNTQITTLNSQLTEYTAQLQAEYAQIQSTVAGYQAISQLFTDNSSSSSSSSTSSSSPGSSLSLSA